MATKTVAAKIDTELYKKIASRSARTHRSVSEVLRETIERGFVERLNLEYGNLACPACAGIGILTEFHDYSSLSSHLQIAHSGSVGGFIDQEFLRFRIAKTLEFLPKMMLQNGLEA